MAFLLNNAPYQQRWLALLKRQECSSMNDTLNNVAYRDLRLRYAEPQRVYHTFEHIKACLHYFDQVSERLECAFEVELALWFHDVIYNPRRQDNELQSAVYAQHQLQKLALPADCIQRVYDFILLTKHPSQPVDNDEKILIDIDLSILGAEPAVFAVYEKNICKEYAWVDKITYQRERVKVLQSFLDQTSLYHSCYFLKRKESLARHNLKQLIHILNERI